MDHATTHQKIAQTEYDIMPQIAERWSPRTFSDRAIDQETVHRLFEAARWAASSRNYQPWRFIYGLKGTEAYDRILGSLVPFNRQWAESAPLLVMTIVKEQMDNGKNNYHALHDLGLAMGNFSVQAQDLGLALHHMAGFDWKGAHEAFDIPEGYHAVTVVAVGHYGGDPETLPEDLQQGETTPRQRKPMDEIVGEGIFPQ
jgi:nitroreductase